MATDLGKVGMVDKGNYNSASTYEAMDVVTYNSATYIAIQNVPVNTAPTNTSYWRAAFNNAIIGNTDISAIASTITEAIKAMNDAINLTLTAEPKTGMAVGYYLVLNLSVSWANDYSLWFQITSGEHIYFYKAGTVITIV